MGRAIRGAVVVRARVVRGTEHGRVIFMSWERALKLLQEGVRAYKRFDRCFRPSAAITAGPLLAILTVAPPPAAD
jgi:3-hydroxyacyl-CoA dehydrogenase